MSASERRFALITYLGFPSVIAMLALPTQAVLESLYWLVNAHWRNVDVFALLGMSANDVDLGGNLLGLTRLVVTLADIWISVPIFLIGAVGYAILHMISKSWENTV